MEFRRSRKAFNDSFGLPLPRFSFDRVILAQDHRGTGGGRGVVSRGLRWRIAGRKRPVRAEEGASVWEIRPLDSSDTQMKRELPDDGSEGKMEGCPERVELLVRKRDCTISWVI